MNYVFFFTQTTSIDECAVQCTQAACKGFYFNKQGSSVDEPEECFLKLDQSGAEDKRTVEYFLKP